MDESNNVLVEDTENERTVAVYEWVEAAIFALVCVVLVFTFLFRIVGVDGESMQTTLMDHDRLILTRLNYTPERGDIVVINRYTQEPLVKRVIAKGNDTLDIDAQTGEVLLNGKVLDEPYLDDFQRTDPMEFQGPITIPEGYVFVMGDNRNNSSDSRTDMVGNIKRENIIGKAWLRIWPVSDFGVLQHQ